ncbi:MAG TPA: protein kinase [Gemmatimonadales bacterium]|nr:protein kinase [Gemmatimonadales bacterium]
MTEPTPPQDAFAELNAALPPHYIIDRELGRGGMALVYLARDTRHERFVALKTLRPEIAIALGRERFLREIKLAARLQHPNILPVYDSGDAAGTLYYVMPFVEGESLRERLQREPQLPVDDALQITKEVAEALAYAHSHDVVHRDIKPENIMLSGGHAIVTDFGIARAVSAAGGDKLTQTGLAIGTPAYMPPEQASGSGQVDRRSDIYSLACVLYETLAGQPPFTGPTAQAIMARHSLDAVPRLKIVRDAIPDELEVVIERALEKVPADRYQTSGEFAKALTAASTGHVSRVTAARRRTRASGWRSPVNIGIGLGVISLAVGAWLLFGRRGAAGAANTEGAMDVRRVAVLYFQDLSPDTSMGVLADGLTEGLIDQLSQVRTLDVVSRNGVISFRHSDLPRDSIARALGAGTLVEGSVEPVRDRVRVTIRLVDGASGADLLRRATVEQPSANPLGIRDTLAAEVARVLRERLGEEVRLREERAGTNNTAAWTLYQQAERLRKNAEGAVLTGKMDSATARFARADSALADAERADPRWDDPIIMRGQLSERRVRLTRAVNLIDEGLGHAARALALAPGDARALDLRGTLRYRRWQLARPPDPQQAAALLNDARTDLERATTLDPNLASAYSTLSSLYYQTKDLQGAALAARRAYEEDAYLSNAPDILYRLFFTSYDLDQQRQAQRWCQEGARRFPQDFRFLECQLYMMTRLEAPDVPRAWRLLGGIDSLTPPPRRPTIHLREQMIVAATIARAGLQDSAHRVIERSRGTPELDPEHDLVAMEAFVRTLLGEQDEAIRLLQRYVAANPEHSFRVGGDVFWWWWDLQKHPGFQALARPHS